MKYEQIAQILIQRSERGTWNGGVLTPYFQSCRYVDGNTGTLLLFTRDVGYHSSGWWKNPDYERCRHLSLSFFDPETREPRPRDCLATREIVKLFFGRDRRLLWCEPPYSDDGKRSDVWHYRLFCDPGWQPIKPRGEVYNRELTEAGWKSYSDARAAMHQEEEALRKILGNARAGE